MGRLFGALSFDDYLLRETNYLQILGLSFSGRIKSFIIANEGVACSNHARSIRFVAQLVEHLKTI